MSFLLLGMLGTVRNIVAQADGLIGKGRLEKILQTIGIRRPAPGV